jgi:hypothetical protein
LKHQFENHKFSTEDQKRLNVLRNSGFQKHLVGALYWKYKTHALFSLFKAQKPVIVVSYERLVKYPYNELVKLIDFLGLEWEYALLKHNERNHSELDANGLAIGGTNPKIPIHRNSIKSYEGFFSDKQLKEMYEIVYETLVSLSLINISYQ